MTRRFAVLIAAIAVLGGSVACAPASTGPLPVTYNVTAAVPYLLQPGKPPAGSNDNSCRPSAAHPYPVVLVHGTTATMGENWATLSPLLKNNGYCVFAFNYGGTWLSALLLGNIQGLDGAVSSAKQLATFVDSVRATTGASKVDLVGHSQGGLMPRYYLNFLKGGAKVRNMVALAPSSHGTTFLGLVTLSKLLGFSAAVDAMLAGFCTSCVQQEVGSEFVRLMGSVPDTVPGVRYTVISSRYDEIVTPYESQFLSGRNVRNITLQDVCALDNDGHAGIAWDRIALNEVLNALDPAHARSVPCTFIPFDFGG